jgi:predicted metalloendopeptidase
MTALIELWHRHNRNVTSPQGRQFDKDGNLVEWWEPDTKKKYLQKAKCIIEQYGNYTEEETGMHVSCPVFPRPWDFMAWT